MSHCCIVGGGSISAGMGHRDGVIYWNSCDSIAAAGTTVGIVLEVTADSPEEVELVALEWQPCWLSYMSCVGRTEPRNQDVLVKWCLGVRNQKFLLWLLSPTSYGALGNLPTIWGRNFHISKWGCWNKCSLIPFTVLKFSDIIDVFSSLILLLLLQSLNFL